MAFVGIVLAAAIQAASAPEPAAAETGLNITEPRNAATGFAIVNWMTNVDAIGTHCSKLPGEAAERSIKAEAESAPPAP